LAFQVGQTVCEACAWVEENIEETLSFYRLPRQHHKNLKSTNMLERLMEEIKRRTLVVRIFPNAAACLRLVRALAVETHENFHEQGSRGQEIFRAAVQPAIPYSK
jgi:transposase-like protein